MATVLLSGILRGSRVANLAILRHVSTQSRIPRAKKAALTIVGRLAFNAVQTPSNHNLDAFCSCETRCVASGTKSTANPNWSAQQRVRWLVLQLRVRRQARQVRRSGGTRRRAGPD